MPSAHPFRRPGASPARTGTARTTGRRATTGAARDSRSRVVPITGRSTSADAHASRARPQRAPRGSGETPQVRGERTRRRIAEAVITLMEEHAEAPTAKEVAARAGVSVRLVFHHFEDMDTLYRLVADIQVERHWQTSHPPSAELPLDTRIDRTVAQRAKLFDAVAPVRRTALTLTLRYPDVAAALSSSDQMLHSWTVTTFGAELAGAGKERRDLQAALDAALSFETWDRLRRAEHLSSAAARRVVARTVRALLV